MWKLQFCLSRMMAYTMVFRLFQSASNKWRRLDGPHQIAGIIYDEKFKDGETLTERAAWVRLALVGEVRRCRLGRAKPVVSRDGWPPAVRRRPAR